jgi:hypothetical protein
MMARAWIWIMTAALVCLGGAAAAQLTSIQTGVKLTLAGEGSRSS